MNQYDHEDAFKSANRCAGRLTNLSDALKSVESDVQARAVILDCQDKFERLFTAFLEGVDYGRRNPKEPKP